MFETLLRGAEGATVTCLVWVIRQRRTGDVDFL